MIDGESEIDDDRFFLSKDGKTDANLELHATLDAFFNEVRYDDNSTACKFPARKAWLQRELNITNFPDVECTQYNKVLKRLDPTSATLVFPSAHINSPASMFGHTFIRIDSGYNSKLLSYAINYAADANANETDGLTFALKGLVGGYYGKYSLLPYYEKLKEYRDTEKRDIWEYDLNLSKKEVLNMVRHIWEINGSHSDYYFFTENCSYNMLWLIELARPSIHLREHFTYQVVPLETVHASKLENIITGTNYRASKRSILLEYEELINEKYINIPIDLVNSKIEVDTIARDLTIDKQQKMYILEAAIEYLEYTYGKSDMPKDTYLELFHNFSKYRASLGKGIPIDIKTPANPIDGHRGIKANIGIGFREGKKIGYFGIRSAYHGLEDSNYGFLRGTQIEFLNIELSYLDNKIELEDATILAITSIAQRSEFFKSISWRTKVGFDRDSLGDSATAIATAGAGFSWGNDYGFIYIMADPLLYYTHQITTGIGASVGITIDRQNSMSTNLEATKRIYDSGHDQWIVNFTHSYRLSQNKQFKFNYDYKERYLNKKSDKEETYKITFNYYF